MAKNNSKGLLYWAELKESVKSAFEGEKTKFMIGLILLFLSVFMFMTYVSFFMNGKADAGLVDAQMMDGGVDELAQNTGGVKGAVFSHFLINNYFGIPSIFIIIIIFLIGIKMMKVVKLHLVKWIITCVFLMIWSSILFSYSLSGLFEDTFIRVGGKHGEVVSRWLEMQIGDGGLILLLLCTFLCLTVALSSGAIVFLRKLFSLQYFKRKPKAPKQEKAATEDSGSAAVAEAAKEDEEVITEELQAPDVEKVESEKETEEKTEDIPMTIEEGKEEEETAPDENNKAEEEENGPSFTVEVGKEEPYVPTDDQPYNPRLDLENYKFPTIDLMTHYDSSEPLIDESEQQNNKERIIRTLSSFGIEITNIKATVGPTVTLYEITPKEGVRISKIKGLEDDIALSLSALGIRIIAPIPGKGTIGIEVPNSNPRIVSGQSILGSKKFQETKYDLPIAIGKTITNEVFMVDLCKMPHVLVAGATGQGKSVGLNAMITSLLYKKHPSELKFVLVDPKKVEFSIYSVIENHFLAKLPDGDEAIICDVKKVVQTLNSICVEMDSRYDLLKAAKVRNIKEYNEKFINRTLNPEKGHRFMPYIVVVIDEFGDLIMTAGKEVELPIARIAQLARAVGIHMIIATQRPTTNIITGTIKANFPARIAFRVSAMVDSRTILDRPGANQLIGRGDMLFLQGADPIRVQCAFIDTPEVRNITNFIAKQQGYPTAFYLPEYVEDAGGPDLGDVDSDRLDALFEDAARLIVIHQQGSTSLIQRKFSIGYNRAGRIMDQLEHAGIVGPVQGSKPREVLCMSEMDLDMKLKSILN